MSNVIDQIANESAMTGFGSHSAQQVEELQKALSISQNYGTTAPDSLTGGSALAVEDLDRTLKLVTNTMDHLRLWKDIKKDKISQTVTEYNVQNSYGAEVSPFFAMGGNPTATDANYNREVIQVKYLGTQGQVQHNLTLIQAAHGPVIAREVKNKTIELLTRNERAMITADSSIHALEYDGIDAQIRAKEQQAAYKSTAFAGYESAGAADSVVIDVRGQFTEDVAEDMALVNINNFGMAMDCYISTDDHSRFSKDFYNRQRTVPGAVVPSGNRVKEHQGTIDFAYKPSLFLRGRKAPLAVAISASAAPTLANPATPADTASKFTAADAGDYSYKVSLVFADGETTPSAALPVVGVAAGDKVTADITYTGTPLYANVFRSAKGATDNWEFIARRAVPASGGTMDLDFNAKIPGSNSAYLLMHNEDTLTFKQLGSLIKYDLAVTDTSYKWLQLLYGTPLVSAARKHVIADNITK